MQVRYVYDDIDRIAEIQYNIGESGAFETVYSYRYDAGGRLHSVTDHVNDEATVYRYDGVGNLLQSYTYETEYYHNLYGTTVYYDERSRPTNAYYSFDYLCGTTTHTEEVSYRYSYSYENSENKWGGLTQMVMRDQANSLDASKGLRAQIDRRYDSFGRLQYHTTNVQVEGDASFYREVLYNYCTNGNNESVRVSSYGVTVGATESSSTVTQYRYTYDANGNITHIKDGSNTLLYQYTYDDLGQLIREDNVVLGKTYVYTYDDGGNILTKKGYAYVAGGLGAQQEAYTYTYNDATWEDLLTNWNGYAITYDTIGNPLQWKGASLTWQGRKLQSYTSTGNALSFTYNADGIRTSKTVNGVTHEYILSGSQIIAERWNGNVMLYLYNENGALLGFGYRESSYAEGVYDYYFYDTNLQGDITAIYSAEGVKIGTYTYDAWGNCTVSATEGISATEDAILEFFNPFRYRGYYYDVETGLYYLQSRYYDPEIGRFINVDGIIAGVNGSIQGYNMFAYCFNNPVNMIDSMGNWPDWDMLVKGALLTFIGVGVAAATILTAGTATAPLCTLGAWAASAITTASITTAAIGASEVIESFTGENVIKNVVGEEAYNATKSAAVTVTSMGMTYLASGGNFDICFVAGTPIQTDEGEKAIEHIQPGDMVWAMNEQTGETKLKTVVRTFVNQADELMYITVNGEEIVCTTEHPFYSPVKGWIAACRLRAGDILVLLNGEYVVVEQVQHEILEAPITVYNFEVADFHTYYVGKSTVLVHNTCGGNSSSRGVGGKGWVGDKTWRENVSTVGKGGTITSLNGGIPSKAQAMQLINQSGGTALRIEGAHQFPNPHNYPHINYVTSTGVKGTIKIFE
ncbi:MAG: hypothetical protein E7624_07810 [Ruminococcaceae bacterium]|nr:hypothetical protein [Oscillospiraceae bacterium]